MRLDKFLKVSRIIKRRTVAKELANNNRILVNGRVAKASTTLKIDDVLEIRFGKKIITIKINELSSFVSKDNSSMLYEILEEK